MAITAFYAGLFGLFFLALCGYVVRMRWVTGTALGDGSDGRMQRACRVQGNFIEYVPLILLMLALMEGQGAAGWSLHALALVLLAGRLAHAVGLGRRRGPSWGRTAGTIVTWLVLLVAAATNIYLGAGGAFG